MKTLDQIINEALSCSLNDKIYLIEPFSKKAGLFCSNGDLLYLVQNEEGCKPQSISTDFLQMDTNIYIQSFEDNHSFPDGEYNLLMYKGTNIDNNRDNVDSFIHLCSAHSKLMDGDSFEQFFQSLISLFQLPKEQNYLNLMGLFGELSIIEHIFETQQLDISSYWHLEGSSSKYDFSFPNKYSLEVKASSKGNKAVEIKHAQLFSSPNTVILATIHVIEDNSGISVEELIERMLSNKQYCNNLQFEISLQKELKRVSQDDVRHKRFIINSFSFYLNRSINPFVIIPLNIDKLEYTLDLSDVDSLNNQLLTQYLTF